MNPTIDDHTLLESARQEQARMQTAVAQLEPGGTVQMSRDQFALLSVLIDRLVSRVGCHDASCFNAMPGGIRWWVPLPEFERTRGELEHLRARRDDVTLDALHARELLIVGRTDAGPAAQRRAVDRAPDAFADHPG